MKAVDTNILVRFFVKDDEKQYDQVISFIRSETEENEQLHVPLLVIQELIWVLSKAYSYSREEILHAIDGLLKLPHFSLENYSVITLFLHDAQRTTYDLSDLLIAHRSLESGNSPVVTFDRKSSKHHLFQQLT